MGEATLVFPHQLFKEHPAIEKGRPIVVVEHPWFFTRLKFCKQKLILHRASMKRFAKQHKANYLDIVEASSEAKLFKHLKKYDALHITDLVEEPLEKAFFKACKKHKIDLEIYETPMFCTDLEWGLKNIRSGKKHFMANFYIKQRKRMEVMVKGGKPVGGNWSFDKENRKPVPKNQKIPKDPKATTTVEVKEAIRYVDKHFKDNPGNGKAFHYPISHSAASTWLNAFFKKRFKLFGDYEDAMVAKEGVLFHSVISPLLNIGLLTPQEVIDKAEKQHVPNNSKEGFIRQIIGWREFIYLVYRAIGNTQRHKNHFKHRRKLSNDFWTGETGIDPIDSVIQRLLKTGYTHHIERLMLLGNFMLLTEIHPDDVYTWFMEMYIDSYDWVMVPNVYGMSQYSDGGLMTTKPYFSSSNYILKMSDFEKGDWCQIWDGLFWRFVKKHKAQFQKNMRLKQMTTLLSKMAEDKSKTLFAAAKKYLSK